MNKFEKQLERWNGGILRGAQAKLAKILQVSTATVALWTTGKRRPSKGYLARMAQLFAMDPFDVMRLFPPLTTYPETAPRTAALRDAQDASNAYSADILATEGNSVSIPLLHTVSARFPQYEESDVAEWWTFPRRAAQGGKCLVADTYARARGREDLYLIRPSAVLEEGQIMLLRAEGTLQLKRVRTENGQILLFFPDGTLDKRLPPAAITPLGTAVQKITNVF